MKIYEHNDAFVHLNYIFQTQQEDAFAAVINDTVLHYGEDGGFDREKALELKIPLYNLQKKGGAMVTSPGDIVYCFFLKEKDYSLNEELRKFLYKKLLKYTNKLELANNDLLIDNKKCFGFMNQEIGNMFYSGGHISINCNLELIKQLCTKPMEKVPGGLGDYGITTEEVLAWLNEFWFYYKK